MCSSAQDDEITSTYAAELAQLAAKARNVVRDLDPTVCQRAEIRFICANTQNMSPCA